jgi:hypothetical protein
MRGNGGAAAAAVRARGWTAEDPRDRDWTSHQVSAASASRPTIQAKAVAAPRDPECPDEPIPEIEHATGNRAAQAVHQKTVAALRWNSG